MSRETIATPAELHLGIYRRSPGETRMEAAVVPRKLKLADIEIVKEVANLVATVKYVVAQEDRSTVEIQCSTPDVEKLVRQKLRAKELKRVRFLIPKSREMPGQ